MLQAADDEDPMRRRTLTRKCRKVWEEKDEKGEDTETLVQYFGIISYFVYNYHHFNP